MKGSQCRLLLALLLLVSGIAGLGDHISAAANTSPTVNIRRNNALDSGVVTGDFNGDGIIDLAANDPWVDGPPPLIVTLGKRDGTFGPPIRSFCRCRPLAAGDFDKDGHVDLLVEEQPEPDITVFALRGNGDGTFGAASTVAQAGQATFGLAADVDGDGNLDAVIGDVNADFANDFVIVVPGNGDLTFRIFESTNLVTGHSPLGAAVADLNGDGRKDLAVANHDGHSLSIFLNQGAFRFTPADVPFDRQVNDVAAADVNGDGKLDLVVATALAANDFTYMQGAANVLFGNGDGTFRAPVAYATAPGAWRIVVGDFTRDGIADIATANRSSIYVDDPCGPLRRTWDSVSILPGKGDGTFAAASSFSLHNQADLDDHTFSNTVRSLAVADVNRDGAPDLIASSGAILINQPTDPNWAPTVDLSGSFADTNAVHLRASASDVDQDFLTYSWSSNDGKSIPPVPSACVTDWATPGTHTYTVTVSDGHGHATTQSVSFTVQGAPPADEPITFTAPASGEVVAAGQPYTIRWTSTGHGDRESMNLFIIADNGQQTFIPDCAAVSVGAHQCTWDNPGPVTENAVIFGHTRDADVPASGSTDVFRIRAGAPATGALPNGWQHADIGAVAAAGNATFNNGVFTVSGSGADIWGTADEFHYVYQRTIQRFEITARVDSVQNVNAWTKAGLMVRTSLDPSAPHASIFVTPGRGIAFQRRTAQGATSIHTAGAALTAPVWLRLTMFNGNMRAYYKKNLTDRWTLIGQQVLQMDPNVSPYIGLAVTSHADGTLATAKFSQVRTGLIPDWDLGLIGCTNDGGSFDGTVFDVFSKCTDIWGTADAFNSVMTQITGDATITVHITEVGPTHAWAKAGVMIRETKAAGSKHAFALVTPGKGVNLQYRATMGGASASAASIAGTAPGWLRLSRAGNTFTASWSKDGTTFVPLGSATVAMSSSMLVGMAHTSHNTETYGRALFEEPVISR